MARDWDAPTYDRVANPHERWGRNVVSWLTLRGDERALDAGCGSGRVTAQLLERLPRGRVVALDGSAQMLNEARRRLAAEAERVEFVLADLREPLPLAQPVEAVLSTATFHWLPDHARLYRRLAAVLVPGGQLAAQYGGVGNIARVEAAIRAAWPLDDAWQGPWNFTSPDEARTYLTQAGFVDVDAWLQPEPISFAAGEPLETYLETVVLGAHLERLPPGERTSFVRRVAAGLDRPELDYVRLNVVARRAYVAGGTT
jgi:trans-aconitate 2-methyltransferase